MIVFHIAVATSDDYVTRREPHRRAHLERLQGLRAAGILVGGGPAPDGKSADLFYRLQQPGQVANAMEEDPYFLAGAWTDTGWPATMEGAVRSGVTAARAAAREEAVA